MIGKDYLIRQATTLLKMAKTVTDPQVQAGLATKAAEMQERLEGAEPPLASDAGAASHITLSAHKASPRPIHQTPKQRAECTKVRSDSVRGRRPRARLRIQMRI